MAKHRLHKAAYILPAAVTIKLTHYYRLRLWLDMMAQRQEQKDRRRKLPFHTVRDAIQRIGRRDDHG
jgi:hypothetical protein